MRRLATLSILAGLGLIASTAFAQTYPGAGTPIPIPDRPTTGCGSASGSGAPATSVATVTDSGIVTDADVFIDITHTWVGDLTVTVNHGATTRTMLDRPGGTTATSCGDSSDGAAFFFDDEGPLGPANDAPLVPGATSPGWTANGHYTPVQPLSGFDGALATGTWTLSISDSGGGDTGTLNAWSLVLTRGPVVAVEPGPNGVAFELVGANPVRTQTQFEMTVVETQSVRVAVYDMMGRQVAVVLDGVVAANTPTSIYFVPERVPAGSYVVRATGRTFDETRQLTIVR